MEPPRSHPIAVTLPPTTRPIRHLAYSFDEPLSHFRSGGGGGYVSPEATPTSAAFYAHAHAHTTSLGQSASASLTAPRGYPATILPQGAGLFTTSALGHIHAHGHGHSLRPNPVQAGYKGLSGDYGYGFPAGAGAGGGTGGTSARYDVVGQMPGGVEMDPFFVPALPVRKDDKKGSPKKTRKTSEVKQPTFLTKLYGILEQQEYNHILRWDKDNETIIIERPSELGEKVLPLVYRQSRFASFSRQLNIYGWRRKVSLRHVEEGITDPDASTWSHTTLHRHSPMEEVLNFKRRVGPRPSQSKRRFSVPEPAALSPAGSDLSDPEDAYHRHLLAEDIKPTISSLSPLHPPSPNNISAERPSYHHQYPSSTPGSSAHPTPPNGYRSPDAGYEELADASPIFSDDYPLQPDTLPQARPQFYHDYPRYEPHQNHHQNYQHQLLPQLHQHQHQAGSVLGFGATSPSFNGAQQPNFTSNPYGVGVGLGLGLGIVTGGPSYTSYFPQSAPANSADKSYLGLQQVYQAQLRTRSVQGDPPSATLWSPAPYGTVPHGNSWDSVNGPGTASGTCGPLSAMSVSAGMEYQPTPIARKQEGWVNCYNNEPMSPPPNSLGMIGARMASTIPPPGAELGSSAGMANPAFIPTAFTPTAGMDSPTLRETDGNGGSGVVHDGDSASLGLGEPFQLRPSSLTHTRNDSFSSSHTPPDTPTQLQPGTVSPGAYHSGFTPPVDLLTRSISSPRPHPSYQPFLPGSLPTTIDHSHSLANRQARRQSMSSTPYSPRQRQLSLAQLSMSPSRAGPIRVLGGTSDGHRRSSIGSPTPGVGTGELGQSPVLVDMEIEMGVDEAEHVVVGKGLRGRSEEEGLPSAGMVGFADSPFSSLLRKDEMTDGDD